MASTFRISSFLNTKALAVAVALAAQFPLAATRPTWSAWAT